MGNSLKTKTFYDRHGMYHMSLQVAMENENNFKLLLITRNLGILHMCLILLLKLPSHV